MSLMWHDIRVEDSSLITYATFQNTCGLQNQEFQSHFVNFQSGYVNLLPGTTNPFHFCDIYFMLDDSSVLTFTTFQHTNDPQTKDFKVIISRVVFVGGRGRISPSLAWFQNYNTLFPISSRHGKALSPHWFHLQMPPWLSQYWVLEPTTWYNKFILRLWHNFRVDVWYTIAQQTFQYIVVTHYYEIQPTQSSKMKKCYKSPFKMCVTLVCWNVKNVSTDES